MADESYFGGKPKNRHQQGKRRPGSSRGVSGYPHDKTIIMSLVDKGTGEVRSGSSPT